MAERKTGTGSGISGVVTVVGGSDYGGTPATQQLKVDSNGGISVTSNALPTGGATAANQSTEITALGHLTDGTQSTGLVASTSGGATPYHLISAATTQDQNVKASAGQVYSVQAVNVNAAARYLKLYNKASAPSSADTPVAVFALPPSTPVNMSIPVGLAFSLGIGVRLTTGIADNDNTAVAANEITVHLAYK